MVATDFALFNYDAAMAICIAACEVENDFFSASDLYESMLRTKFDGVTGSVEFDNRYVRGNVVFTGLPICTLILSFPACVSGRGLGI